MSEHSGREVDEFARELAHEMRTSINQVVAVAELRLDPSRERPEAARRKLLEIQRAASARAQRASHGHDAFGGTAP